MNNNHQLFTEQQLRGNAWTPAFELADQARHIDRGYTKMINAIEEHLEACSLTPSAIKIWRRGYREQMKLYNRRLPVAGIPINHKELAKQLSYSRRTIIRAFRELADQGYVLADQTYRQDGGHDVKRYMFILPDDNIIHSGECAKPVQKPRRQAEKVTPPRDSEATTNKTITKPLLNKEEPTQDEPAPQEAPAPQAEKLDKFFGAYLPKDQKQGRAGYYAIPGNEASFVICDKAHMIDYLDMIKRRLKKLGKVKVAELVHYLQMFEYTARDGSDNMLRLVRWMLAAVANGEFQEPYGYASYIR